VANRNGATGGLDGNSYVRISNVSCVLDCL
jgi:hypothetical protein